MRAVAIAALGLASGVSVARPAAAAPPPSVDVRSWRPSPDPQASAVSEPVDAPGPWRWNVAAFTSYARDPVVLRRAGAPSPRPVEDVIAEDLVAAVGMGSAFEVGARAPVVVWQHGTDGGAGRAPSPALGDASLRVKATILPNLVPSGAADGQALHAGLGLAGTADVALPTGNRSGFAGEGAVTGAVGVLAEYAVGIASVRASLGFSWRPWTRTWSAAFVGGGSDVRFGNGIPWSLALVLRPKALLPSLDADDRQLWELAAHGALPAGPVAPFGLGGPNASALSPALLALDDRLAVGHTRDVYVVAGAEIGVDDAIGVPAVRAWVAVGWTPRDHDRDHDGVPDDVDQCPDLPEDRDGIQDSDGCPEDDADGDGVLDAQDACPLTPGPASPDPRMSGCAPGAGGRP